MGNRLASILFVIGTSHVGGTEHHLTDIARALAKRGWDVSIYSLTKGGPLQAIPEDGGINVFLSPARFCNTRIPILVHQTGDGN